MARPSIKVNLNGRRRQEAPGCPVPAANECAMREYRARRKPLLCNCLLDCLPPFAGIRCPQEQMGGIFPRGTLCESSGKTKSSKCNPPPPFPNAVIAFPSDHKLISCGLFCFFLGDSKPQATENKDILPCDSPFRATRVWGAKSFGLRCDPRRRPFLRLCHQERAAAEDWRPRREVGAHGSAVRM